MKKIRKPLAEINGEEVYVQCVLSYKDEKKQTKLMGYRDIISRVTKDYGKSIPHNFSDFNHPEYTVETKKEMSSVYTDCFVEKRVGGFYDSIMENAHGLCPFCGEGVPRNLDHFLPKSNYPFLSVTPENLVPSCRDCNMEKSSIKPSNNDDVPLHPYYDKIDVVWIAVCLDFSRSEYIGVSYYNCLDEKDSIAGRIDAHIKAHALKSTFETHANSMLNSEKRSHKKLAEQSYDTLRKHLCEELESFEADDINSWRSALYRELVVKYQEYAEWLIRYRK